MEIHGYQVILGMSKPVGRASRRVKLDALIALANEMPVNAAAVMSCCDAQTFRLILNVLGFDCISDGYRSEVFGKTLIFKLPKNTAPPRGFVDEGLDI